MDKDTVRIYTITGITDKFPKDQVRLFGWFPFFEEAEKAVLDNSCGMDEGSFFKWIVIEECESGIYGFNNYSTWYKWDGEKYNKSEKPLEYKRMINFSIG